MKTQEAQNFIDKLGSELSDIKFLIPVSEDEVLTLKQKVQAAGFCCMIECSAMNPFQLVVTDLIPLETPIESVC